MLCINGFVGIELKLTAVVGLSWAWISMSSTLLSMVVLSLIVLFSDAMK